MKLLTAANIKNCIFLIVIGMTVGFFAGGTVAGYTVFVRQYLPNGLYFLSASIILQWINRGIGLACVIGLAAVILVGIAHALSRFFFSPVQGPARARQLSALFLGTPLCIWGIYTVNTYAAFIAASRYHINILASYAGIVLCVLLLGWMFMKMNMQKLLARIKPAFILLALFALIIACAINGSLFLYEAYAIPEKPNVILISIDTLRADHVSCYGYHRNTTPHIDTFAREGILFNQAFVHEGWTLPSHMSMLTGLCSLTHGVGADYTTSLPFGIVTLPELLKNTGYATMGFASGTFWMYSGFGFGRGFDYYNLSLFYNPNIPERNAEYQNKFIQQYVSRNKKKNNFIFIHYYDVHSDAAYLPYDAPPPYASSYTDSGYDLFAGVETQYRATNYLSYLMREKIMPTPQQLEYIVGLYDNNIAYVDKCIGDLFGFLKEQGLYDNSIIILTADHGESLGEHRAFVHGNAYRYDEEMHIPLIIKLPDKAGAQPGMIIEGLVEIIDIVPTIFDYVAIDGFPIAGISLRRMIENATDEKDYILGLTALTPLYIRSKKWKLMSDDGLNRNRYRLFDLENDPGEQQDIAAENPKIVEFLEKKLRIRIEESRGLRASLLDLKGTAKDSDPGRQLKIDDQQKERLKSLGYIL